MSIFTRMFEIYIYDTHKIFFASIIQLITSYYVNKIYMSPEEKTILIVTISSINYNTYRRAANITKFKYIKINYTKQMYVLYMLYGTQQSISHLFSLPKKNLIKSIHLRANSDESRDFRFPLPQHISTCRNAVRNLPSSKMIGATLQRSVFSCDFLTPIT